MYSSDDKETRIFGALSNSSRREIISLLVSGSLATSDIAAAIDLTIMGAAKHLDILSEALIVSSVKIGRKRMWTLLNDGLDVIRDYPDLIQIDWLSLLAIDPDRVH